MDSVATATTGWQQNQIENGKREKQYSYKLMVGLH